MTAMEKIERWLKRRGYSILLDKSLEWEVRFYEKLVTGDPAIFTCQNNMIAVLLHECGHVDQCFDATWKWYRVPRPRKGKKPKNSYYIAVLETEIDAWKRAEKIAEELEIKNMKSAFRRTKFWRLMTYVKWAAQKGSPCLLEPNKIENVLKKLEQSKCRWTRSTFSPAQKVSLRS